MPLYIYEVQIEAENHKEASERLHRGSFEEAEEKEIK